MNGHANFTCSICGEPSTMICRFCTHDACGNHLCERCGRCSDCCPCDIHARAAIADFAAREHNGLGLHDVSEKKVEPDAGLAWRSGEPPAPTA